MCDGQVEQLVAAVGGDRERAVELQRLVGGVVVSHLIPCPAPAGSTVRALQSRWLVGVNGIAGPR